MPKIIGDITTTPMAVPDWNQTDSTKADYIKNKPDVSSINSLKYYGDANIVPTEKKEYTIDNEVIVHCYFNYTDNGDGTCTITGWNDMILDVWDIVVPYEIDGLKVTKIASGSFDGWDFIKSLTLPNTVISLEASFSSFFQLETITIPASVTFIADNAFSGCAKVVISCDAGSYAETYAKENGIKYDNGMPEALTHKITELYIEPYDVFCYVPDFEGSTAIFSAVIDKDITFVLPYFDSANEFKQLLIHANVNADNASINWGIDRFFNGEIPDIGIGKYDFIFEWDGTEWCAGAIEKGVVS